MWRRMVLIPLPHWVADNHMTGHKPRGMNCTAVRAVTSGPHTNKRSLYFPMLHQKCWVVTPTQLGPASRSTVKRNTVTLHPLASSQYSCKASGPQYGPNTTMPLQGTCLSQRGSRWWIYHMEWGSCYYMWKHVTLYNQIFIYIFPFYMWEKQVWSFAAPLKDPALKAIFT